MGDRKRKPADAAATATAGAVDGGAETPSPSTKELPRKRPHRDAHAGDEVAAKPDAQPAGEGDSASDLDQTLGELCEKLGKEHDINAVVGITKLVVPEVSDFGFCLDSVPVADVLKWNSNSLTSDTRLRKMLNDLKKSVWEAVSAKPAKPIGLSDIRPLVAVTDEGWRTSAPFDEYLVRAKPMFESLDLERRNGHACLVISGESGAGKTITAVSQDVAHLLFKKQKKTQGAPKHTTVFYAKVSHDERSPVRWSEEKKLQDKWATIQAKHDREKAELEGTGQSTKKLDRKHEVEMGDFREERNNEALNLLENIWKRAVAQLQKDHSATIPKEVWKELGVVLVIDELGDKLQLLRGLVACAADFELKMCREVAVAGVRVVLVGTALDWAVSLPGIASDSAQFVHVRMQAWDQVNLEKYLSARIDTAFPKQRKRCQRVVEECMTLSNLVALGSNARCAYFLANAIISTLSQVRFETNGYIEGMVEAKQGHIFEDVAASYKSMNGLYDLQASMEDEFLPFVMGGLKYALRKTRLPELAADDMEHVRKLLVYGVLTYRSESETVHVSAALLLMVLSGFGWRSLPLLKRGDLRTVVRLVAMREMANILFDEPGAKVALVLLQQSVPSDMDNESQRKDPHASFSVELPDGLFVEKDGCLVPKQGSRHLVLVNGSEAAGPDVLVFSPAKTKKLRLVLAKCRSAATSAEEASKLGLCRKEGGVSHPATWRLLRALAHGRQVERVVAHLESGSDDPVEEEVYQDCVDKKAKRAMLKHEWLEEGWRQLLPQQEARHRLVVGDV